MDTVKRKYPPAMARYRAKHPVVSATMTRELKEVLDLVRGERSYNKAFQDLLNEKLSPVLELKKRMEQEQARKIEDLRKSMIKLMESRMLIKVPCSDCGKLAIFTNYSEGWDTIYRAIKDALGELDLQCKECTAKD